MTDLETNTRILLCLIEMIIAVDTRLLLQCITILETITIHRLPPEATFTLLRLVFYPEIMITVLLCLLLVKEISALLV